MHNIWKIPQMSPLIFELGQVIWEFLNSSDWLRIPEKHSKMFVIDDLVCFQISQYLGCYIQSVNGNMLISAGCQKEVYIEV